MQESKKTPTPSPTPSAAGSPPQAEGDISDLEELKAQCEEYLNGWKRAQADYANLKKETEIRQQEMREQAKIQAIMEFLPIYTNLQLATSHIPTEQKEEGWVVGISHIVKQFDEALSELGLARIQTEGELFNPEHHEAVGKEKKEGVDADMIISESMPGYMLGDKVIVPAKVIVSE